MGSCGPQRCCRGALWENPAVPIGEETGRCCRVLADSKGTDGQMDGWMDGWRAPGGSKSRDPLLVAVWGGGGSPTALSPAPQRCPQPRGSQCPDSAFPPGPTAGLSCVQGGGGGSAQTRGGCTAWEGPLLIITPSSSSPLPHPRPLLFIPFFILTPSSSSPLSSSLLLHPLFLLPFTPSSSSPPPFLSLLHPLPLLILTPHVCSSLSLGSLASSPGSGPSVWW